MEAWREEWRRIGFGMIATAFALWIGRLTADHQTIVPNHGKPYEIPGPNGWVVWLFAGVALLGAWCWLATWSSKRWLWAPGKGAAAKPDCELEADFEFDQPTTLKRPPDNSEFHECTYVFLTVHNTGGTAEFVAQFSGIKGVKRDNGDSVDTHTSNLAWETTAEARQTIGADGRARLVAMMLFRRPVSGWFSIPHLSIWSGLSEPHQMSDWLLVPSDPFAPLEFDVQIINETKMTSANWHVLVEWEASGEVKRVTAVPR